MTKISPCCCVPIFLADAIRISTEDTISPREIAERLDVRVSSQDANPWELSVACDSQESGITLSEVEAKVPQLLLPYSLLWRHLRLNKIALEQYAEEAQALLQTAVSVGIGFDAGLLYPENGGLNHLAKVHSTTLSHVDLSDCGLEGEIQMHRVKWDDLASTSLRIGDGFWIIEKHEEA